MISNQKSYIYVSADGRGDYGTVQEAIDAVPVHNSAPVIIKLARGEYYGCVSISGDKPYISIEGESKDNTVITYDSCAARLRADGDITGTFRSATFSVFANYFSASNITFRNSHKAERGAGGQQAPALHVFSERALFENCRITGSQDTLYAAAGSQLYRKCFIEGGVDFIFGGARAVFEDCRIHSVKSGGEGVQGWIAAPSTPVSQKFGFLFLECNITSDCPDGTVFLGRPWHPGLDPLAVGACVFMRCNLGAHIKAEGWSEMSGFLPQNARLFEYRNTGAGALINSCRRQLTEEQAAEWSIDAVLRF